MESNDKLEELLRQMYAEETQVDLDEEWQKFEVKHFPLNARYGDGCR